MNPTAQKKSPQTLLYLLGTLILICAACRSLPMKRTGLQARTATHYVNPVLDTILADPSVVKDPKSGYYYAYGTEDNWGDGQGSRLIPIMRSTNLVNWSSVGNAFDVKPSWKEKGGLWAPDINLVNGRYHLYYSFSTWGDPDPGIGLAIASQPEGPFIDQGKLFSSKEIEVPNSIDPFFYQDEGRNYLFWGSFSDHATQGTYGIETSSDGKTVPDLSKKFKVAAGDFEAVMIHKKDGFYYFFGSKGACCEGSKSTYRVKVARAAQLTGPYLDRAGNDILERNRGSLLIKGNDVYVGPGHNARLLTDDQGTDWLMYHAIDKTRGSIENGPSRRILMLDQVHWKNGWPEIEGASPSTSKKKAPVFY